MTITISLLTAGCSIVLLTVLAVWCGHFFTERLTRKQIQQIEKGDYGPIHLSQCKEVIELALVQLNCGNLAEASRILTEFTHGLEREKGRD